MQAEAAKRAAELAAEEEEGAAAGEDGAAGGELGAIEEADEAADVPEGTVEDLGEVV